jgi:hypothetical protein
MCAKKGLLELHKVSECSQITVVTCTTLQPRRLERREELVDELFVCVVGFGE